MLFKKTHWLALFASALISAGAASAQDSGPLLNLLVKKGIVSDQEAEDLRAELTKDFAANTSAGKLNLSSSLVEFKLSGDLRIRGQYETQAPEVRPATAPDLTNERFRNRFRFRFNGDVILQKGWTAGFALETATAADSGNQTLQDGMDDYAVSLARAYVGWRPNMNWAFVAGKQKNLLFTTDLVWDADINPQGFSETYTAFFGAKDTFEVRAGQWIMDDRNESVAGPNGRDAWLFTQQAIYTKWFGADALSNVILAPGFMKYNSSYIDGQTGEAAFTTTAPGLPTTRYLTNFVFPGEVNFANIAGPGTSLKAYWDYSHNFESEQRVYKMYGVSRAFDDDPDAYLAGVGYAYGLGKVQGDYSLKVDYRSIGIGSIDPNINDSDFGFSFLNQQGWKAAFSYNVTDFTNLNLTYITTRHKQDGLNQAAIAARHHTQLLQVDLVLKF